MTFYLDTSFVAPLILEEATSEKIETFLTKLPADSLCVSPSVLERKLSLQASSRVKFGWDDSQKMTH